MLLKSCTNCDGSKMSSSHILTIVNRCSRSQYLNISLDSYSDLRVRYAPHSHRSLNFRKDRSISENSRDSTTGVSHPMPAICNSYEQPSLLRTGRGLVSPHGNDVSSRRFVCFRLPAMIFIKPNSLTVAITSCSETRHSSGCLAAIPRKCDG